MRRLGADCLVVVMKRGNARGAKGAGHRHLNRMNRCWVQPAAGGIRWKKNGRRQPSRDGTSRMMREYQVRICEGLGVKFPGPTRQKRRGRQLRRPRNDTVPPWAALFPVRPTVALPITAALMLTPTVLFTRAPMIGTSDHSRARAAMRCSAKASLRNDLGLSSYYTQLAIAPSSP